MPNITDMNLILGQGSAIKQMGTPTEQNVELNRQFINQAANELRKKEKTRIKNIKDTYKSQIGPDTKKRKLSSPSHDASMPPEKKEAPPFPGDFL